VRRLRSRTALRVLVLVVAVALFAVLRFTEAGAVLTDRQRAEDFLTDSGALGPLAFLVAFAASHPVGLPSVALTFVAGVVWPAPVAVALSWLGGMCGALVAFSFARWFARDWVDSRIGPRFRRFEQRLEHRAVPTVVLVRLFTYLPPPADWFFAVSHISLRQFVVGTAIGILPATVFIVLAGDSVTGWAGGPAGLVVIAAFVVGGLGYLLLRRRRARGAAHPGVA